MSNHSKCDQTLAVKARLLIFLVCSFAYGLAFVLAYPFVGSAAALFGFLAAIVIGWSLGIRAGVVFGVLSVPINIVLFTFMDSPIANSLPTRIFAGLAFLAIGAGTGWIKKLLDQLKHQARQLSQERENLQEQITKRQEVEAALQATQDNLQHLVAERTTQLQATNERLEIELAERSRTEAESRLYVGQLESLRQMELEIAAELDLNSVLLAISERAVKLMGGIAGSIYLYRPEREVLERVAVAARSTALSARTRQRGEGLIGKVWASGQPIVQNDYGQWNERSQAYDSEPSRNVMGVPIYWGHQFLGVETIITDLARPFTEADVALISSFTTQAAIAIHNAQLYRAAQQEIVERKRAEGQLIHDAFHDALTGLPNRALFTDRLEHALERARRRSDSHFAVLFLDLDRFKLVNDSLGHSIGDRLLIESARRLEASLRSVDTVARIGGDEFVILVEEVEVAEELERVATRIENELALPYDLDGHRIFISASIGVVTHLSAYQSAEDILRDADIAMYRAKALGKGRHVVFDATLRERAMALLNLETDLRRALERHEFVVHYQPVVSLATSGLIGFEALTRWQHPERGLVAPSDFIPLAEETGLIIPMGLWVLGEACRQMHEWQAEFPKESALTVSVNLSPKQFAQANLVDQIAEILEETGLASHRLVLEITESALMDDTEAAAATLEKLRGLGVEVELDDFGTGYSSLGYLQRFPLDGLKIDRTFVSKIGVNGNGIEIIRTIVELAHQLGMKVIAEGVETSEQLDKLKGLECEFGQGYIFARPLDRQAAGTLIAQRFPMVK